MNAINTVTSFERPDQCRKNAVPVGNSKNPEGPVDAWSGSWDDDPPTRSQLACLARMGIDVRTVHTKQQASMIIRYTPHATPTVKQIELLTRKGFRNVTGWTYQQAHELITRISDNCWRIPADIGDPAAYVPC